MAETLKPNRRIVTVVKETLLKREALRASKTNYFVQDEVLRRGRLSSKPLGSSLNRNFSPPADV